MSMENIETGLLLMIVGMTTVFCYPDDRYLSWEGPDRTGKQICARRDYC